MRVRRRLKIGEVARTLREGRLIKTWAMRGTLHLLTPEDAGMFSRSSPPPVLGATGWQTYFGVTPKHSMIFARSFGTRSAGRRSRAANSSTRVIARRGYGHLGDALRSGWGTLLKPYAWQGDLCFGPSQGNRVTFTTPMTASSRWAGVPGARRSCACRDRVVPPRVRSGGRRCVRSLDRVRPDRQAPRSTWFDALGRVVAEVDVGGERAYVLAEDLDDLRSTKPTRTLRLLPGFDQFVLGPGRATAMWFPRTGAVR